MRMMINHARNIITTPTTTTPTTTTPTRTPPTRYVNEKCVRVLAGAQN